MRLINLTAAAALILSAWQTVNATNLCADGETGKEPHWQLVWEENFNDSILNPNYWSRTERGTPDWANTQSDDPRCIEISNGTVRLIGIVNNDTASDPAPYLTGGIWTKNKKSFGPGPFSIQVKARLGEGAKGAWPAIWLMPFNQTEVWPDCGEIDIMERLNHDKHVYQTVHSHYTHTLGNITTPPNSKVTKIDPATYHIYEAQVWPDRVEYYIDHVKTFTYPIVNDGADLQFPFNQKWHLLIDQQLGGSWVGEVDPAELPTEMEVDWVKYYGSM
ncbi:MAG: glycoside hydrolase family 16 protein [Paramuribaculum sp.]|nr:glycoside hydrolase family 16 protein [Paramuribaculum sp.]